MSKYAAKLLFEWHPDPDGDVRARRLCETTIRVFTARSPRQALSHAKRLGRQSEFRWGPKGRRRGRYGFVGILQLMELGVESERNEVWWEISRKLRPMERRKLLVPAEDKLWVFTDLHSKRSTKHAARAV